MTPTGCYTCGGCGYPGGSRYLRSAFLPAPRCVVCNGSGSLVEQDLQRRAVDASLPDFERAAVQRELSMRAGAR